MQKTYKRDWNNGKFSKKNVLSNRYEMNNFIFRWMLRGLIAIFIYAGGVSIVNEVNLWWGGVVNHQKELYYEARRISAYVPILPQIAHAEKEDVEALKAEVVERLRVLESSGYVSSPDKIFQTYDPAPSMKKRCAVAGGIMPLECSSFGEFQAKVGTVKMWQKMLGEDVMTDREAMELALDTPRMREFVTRVIFDLPPGQIWHWSAAVKEKGWFNEKITHIREISK